MSAAINARYVAALELRLAGLTYQQIADRLGYSDRSSVYSSIRWACRHDEQLLARAQAVRAGLRVANGRWTQVTGYIVNGAPGHPLAQARGRVYEHRRVLYDAIGDGPHLCAGGCGQVLDWPDIVVDHINGVRDDNRIENLRVACLMCNVTVLVKERANAGDDVLEDWWHGELGRDAA